ncbi:hypothetical protein IQ251_12960 [Saccharopolyspora sp. HNM0983]|uniref:Uncharacterized protein n=1 Tax=Saccharopolyspora montiporae TaxID=2781240 RepID=A0A929BC75_9PSEU|nr:hypothetical protein [Saccharopolyspora sp. HNM0983]MBE9375356.1 hypothetical protein [Saccharopolyspora sp. HNM0983]
MPRTESTAVRQARTTAAAKKTVEKAARLLCDSCGARCGTNGTEAPLFAALQDFDRRLPGFESDVHGVRRAADGGYLLDCVVD